MAEESKSTVGTQRAVWSEVAAYDGRRRGTSCEHCVGGVCKSTGCSNAHENWTPRVQVENRIAALMTEPLTICGEYRDGWEAADKRIHEANARLERCLDERAGLVDKLKQALATVAEQAVEIRQLRRGNRK